MKVVKKKTWRKILLLSFALAVLVAVVAALSVFASADQGKVIYISATGAGTGDGSSPANAMGNDAGYAASLAADTASLTSSSKSSEVYKGNAFYKAMRAIVADGKDGTIVIVGDVSIDSAEAMSNGGAASYMYSGWKNAITITVTSNYGGVDYRSGAKLILDRTKASSTNLLIGTKSAWKDLNIEYRYNNNVKVPSTFESEFCFEVYTGSFTADGINTVSMNYTDPNNPVSGDRYPSIIGGRASGSDNWIGAKTITLNSGTWANVIAANHGNTSSDSIVKAAEIVVNGATVGNIYGAGSPQNSRSSIDTDTNITVQSGNVGAIYGVSSKGIKGKLTISVLAGSKVGEINYSAGTPSLLPTSATVTYDLSAVSPSMVKGFDGTNATLIPTGSLPNNMEVIYVANTAKGTGDGSSADNAMGNDADYDTILAYTSIAEADRTDAQKDALKNLYKKNVFYKALSNSQLIANGGYIVVVDEATINVASPIRSSMSEFSWPATISNEVTFTSVYGGVDYRTKGAKLVLDVTKSCVDFDLKGPTVWENIDIEHKYNSSVVKDAETAAMISCNCNKTVFGEGITVTATDVNTTKKTIYPTITGGHRYNNLKKDSDITIKSGSWGSVFGANFGTSTVGDFTGNVTILVEGGTIELLSGGNKNTNTAATTKVTGNISITVNGGTVTKLMGTSHNGLGSDSNTIVVNVGEKAKVGTAWGFHYTTNGASKQPKNSTINYDSNALSSDNIKYFTTVNQTNQTSPSNPSNPSNPSDPTVPTGKKVIYVANTAKGTGDGSSADNAMGNDADYNTILAYTSIAEADRTQAQTDALKNLYKKNVFYKALSDAQLIANGGTIVVVDEATIDVAAPIRLSSMSEFPWPATISNDVTFTSVYGGVDYRTQGAKLVMDVTKSRINFEMKAPTVWENINIEHKYSSAVVKDAEGAAMFSCNCNKTVFGEGITVTTNDINSSKSVIYPTIVGGHRYNNLKKNSDITIKSGSWGCVFGANFGTSTVGDFTGNVTILVEGGTIELLSGGNKNTNTAATPIVTGNINITVNGGKVTKIMGTSHNGFGDDSNTILVTIGEKASVDIAWGFHYTDKLADKQPKNSKIVYASKAIRSDSIKYFADTQMVGDPNDQPDKEYFAVYIADVARGTGDGSSADNAMGNDADYNTILAYASIPEADRTQAQTDALKTLYMKSAVYKALLNKNLMANGGYIVFVGETTINAASPIRLNSMSEFTWPSASSEVIRFTSVYKGVDYRTQGAKLVMDVTKSRVNFEMKAPTVWENINIEHKYSSAVVKDAEGAAMFSCNCNKTVFGEGITVTANDVNSPKTNIYPTIIGGHRYNNLKANSDITIKSGTWGCVFGANFGTATIGDFTGDVTILVEGGTIELLSGGNKNTNTAATPIVTGNINITVNGGKVTKIMGTSHNGLGDDSNTILVTIGEKARVDVAWGFHYTDKLADKQPKNSKIVYASKAIRSDSIKYFADTQMIGDPNDQPEKTVYAVYVADVARGTGDGSSPENAMGNDADYNTILAYASIPEADRTQAQTDALKTLYMKNAVYKALKNKNLMANGGYIVFVGETTINVASPVRLNSMSEFTWPSSGDEVITFTSVFKGVDYRTQGAKLVMDVTKSRVNFEMKAPTVWENINIEHKYSSDVVKDAEGAAMFSGNCNKTVFGEGITVTANDITGKNVKMYPTIVGGHRYNNLKANSDITIKSGTWGCVFGANFGTASVGDFTGDVKVLVEGGTIFVLSGGNKNTNTAAKPVVNGNITITATGGKIWKLMGTSHNGLEGDSNTINVVLGDDVRVGQAWGFHYTDKLADKQPKNSTITYSSKSINSEYVKYFTNAVMVGDPSLAPQPMLYTVYIADKAKGKGDGTSAQNAMGNDADYAKAYQNVLNYLKIDEKNRTQAQKDAISNLIKKNALYKAMLDPYFKLLGGKIVIVDKFTIDCSSPLRMSYAEFTLPGAINEKIIITSRDNGVDYRNKGAKIVYDTTNTYAVLTMNAPTIWEYLNIEHKYNSDNGAGLDATAMIACNGYETVFGYGLNTYNTDAGSNPRENYPIILGGHRWRNLKTNTNITIKSGTWMNVYGANYGVGADNGSLEGNVLITVTGGKINNIIGTNKAHVSSHTKTVKGNVAIRIWGGEVGVVYGTNHNGLINGYVSVSIGKNAKVNAAFGYHPDFDGVVKAYLYYYPGTIPEKQIKLFVTATPQTSSNIVVFVGVAALAGVGAVAAGIKTKKRKSK